MESGSSYGANGSRYRLEIDNFTRITLHGSITDPQSYFTVHEKDGSVSTYGWDGSNTDESAHIFAEVNNMVYAWPISRNEDRAGNFILYKYTQPGKNAAQPWIEWVPDEIWYTGNSRASQDPYAHIKFNSSPHSLSSEDVKYAFGERLKTTRIVDAIRSYSDGPIVRNYDLTYSVNHYGKKVLTAITECMDLSGSICYESTTFDWSDGYVSIFNGNVNPSPVPQFVQDDFRGARAGDVNGDGRQEIVVMVESDNNDRALFGVYRNADPEGIRLNLTRSSLVSAACSTKARDIGGWTLVDLEGNGYQGLVYAIKECTSSVVEPGVFYHPWNHQLNAFSNQPVRLSGLSSFATFDDHLVPRITAMDLDGDGLSDLLLTRSDNDGGAVSGYSIVAWAYMNESANSQIAISDPKNVRGVFDHISLTGCDENAEQTDSHIFKLFSAPIASVDHSGRAALIGEAHKKRECVEDRTRSAFYDIAHNDNFVMSIEELESRLLNRDVGITVYEGRSTAVFEIEIDRSGASVNADATVWSEIITQPDDKIIPTDYNLDGYTDYVTLRKNGDRTDVRLHINDGISLPGIEPDPITVPVKFEIANSIQVRDFTGSGYPDFVAPSGNDDGRSWFEYYEWPWYSPSGGTMANGIDVHSITVQPDKGDQVLISDMYLG